MPAEIMVVNPKRRRGPRRMSALQRLYFGKRRGGRRRRVTYARRNPAPIARRRASAPAPVRRSSSRRRRSRAVYSRYARRRSRNIGTMAGGFVANDVVPALIGGAGALALDMLWPHMTFLPTKLQTDPILNPAARIAGAVGLGLVAGMVGGRAIGRRVMIGAMTVTAYDVIKGYMANNMPAPTPAAPAPAVSGYAPPRLGWVSPAMDAGGRGGLRGYAPMGGYAPRHY